MSLYIVFHKISSLLDEIIHPAEFIEGHTAITGNSLNKLNPAAKDVNQLMISNENNEKILFKDGDSPDAANAVIDYNKDSINALLSKIPAASAPQSTQSIFPKIETESSEQKVEAENYYPAFEKLDVSLRYRHDYADILRSRLEAKNSESIRKLTEKSQEKERAGQNGQTELRFQEKQTENFKKCLKQRRLASHLLNKPK